MTKNSESISLAQAFEALALHLTDDIEVVDQSTGELMPKNNMAYAQRRVLNGIAYSTELTLVSTGNSITKAADKLRALTRSNNGTNQPEIDRQCEWIERLQMQRAVLDNVLNEAKAAHLLHTGEEYVPASTQQRNRQLQAGMVKTGPAMDRAYKLLQSYGITDGGSSEIGVYDSTVHSSDPAETVSAPLVNMSEGPMVKTPRKAA